MKCRHATTAAAKKKRDVAYQVEFLSPRIFTQTKKTKSGSVRNDDVVLRREE